MLHEAANECIELSCASVGSVGEITLAVPVVLHERFQLYYVGGSSWIAQAGPVVLHRRFQLDYAGSFSCMA